MTHEILVKKAFDAIDAVEAALAVFASRAAVREDALRAEKHAADERVQDLRREVSDAYTACEERIRNVHAEITARAEAQVRDIAGALREDAKTSIAKEREAGRQATDQEIEAVRTAARDEIENIRLAACEEINVIKLTARDENERLRADLEVARRERDVALRRYVEIDKETAQLQNDRLLVSESVKRTDAAINDIQQLLSVFGSSPAVAARTPEYV